MTDTRIDLACARGDDRLPMLGAAIDPARLINRWRNTYEHTNGISELTISLHDGQLYVRVTAVGRDGPVEWGEVPATTYADISVTGGNRSTVDPITDGRPTPHYADVSATDGGPMFFATFDHGFQRVHLQARFNIGILPIGIFTEFLDDSGRADYFMREVFIR